MGSETLFRIRSAIQSSNKSGQIINVDVDCPADQLEDLLLLSIACDWEMCEIEDNKVDVWGWKSYSPKDQFEFQLTVQCQPEQVEG